MAIVKIATVAAVVAATLLVLATAAPLARHPKVRARRLANTGSLENVSAGLTILYKISVYELMNRLNLSSSVNASSLHNYPTLAFALDLTCDLSRASTELIPNITNTNITSVVGRLNAANLKDSCLWLNQVINSTDVNTTGSEVDCESQENITDVCKRWGSIKQFNSTLSAVHSLDPNTVNASVGCWIEGKQLSNSTAATIRRIL